MKPAVEKENKQVKTDPELLKQINTVAAEEKPVEAVFMLRPDKAAQIAASPERTEELTHKILERVEKRVGATPKQVNIFRNLGTFAISAGPGFLRELLTQPEIASAMANRQQSQGYIPPRDVKPVDPDSDIGWRSAGSTAKKSSARSKASRSSSGHGDKAAKSVKGTRSSKSGK